ncbi:uncharacterized protein LOC131230964 isoform X2 [Magnolia sinica]|uniref:uncharacterized protein LOC131230964 isoform X2 n=1 Tax=Magnolia sinica TaxID=86752 RepID=UPI00265AB45B|nr:uncharacterized protein LOC131230964 isoform X2 [Magnolia sinica]
MAEDIIDRTVVGFEEGRLWLPSQLLRETCESKYPNSFHKPGSRSRHKPRFPPNRTSGGRGMQAIFLGSSQRPCGTGFFLPRRPGDDFQPGKKPGCSTVLVPSRVVEALNLNVHALGSPPPQRETIDNLMASSRNCAKNKNDNEGIQSLAPPQQQCRAFSKSRSSSPEIFLPKEWSY